MYEYIYLIYYDNNSVVFAARLYLFYFKSRVCISLRGLQ